jgi:hypothetical protein
MFLLTFEYCRRNNNEKKSRRCLSVDRIKKKSKAARKIKIYSLFASSARKEKCIIKSTHSNLTYSKNVIKFGIVRSRVSH